MGEATVVRAATWGRGKRVLIAFFYLLPVTVSMRVPLSLPLRCGSARALWAPPRRCGAVASRRSSAPPEGHHAATRPSAAATRGTGEKLRTPGRNRSGPQPRALGRGQKERTPAAPLAPTLSWLCCMYSRNSAAVMGTSSPWAPCATGASSAVSMQSLSQDCVRL